MKTYDLRAFLRINRFLGKKVNNQSKIGLFLLQSNLLFDLEQRYRENLVELKTYNYVKYAFFGGNFILLIICFLKIWHHFVKFFHNVNLSLLLKFLISFFSGKSIFSCRIGDIFKIVTFRFNYSRYPLKKQPPAENFDTSNVKQIISKIFPI